MLQPQQPPRPGDPFGPSIEAAQVSSLIANTQGAFVNKVRDAVSADQERSKQLDAFVKQYIGTHEILVFEGGLPIVDGAIRIKTIVAAVPNEDYRRDRKLVSSLEVIRERRYPVIELETVVPLEQRTDAGAPERAAAG